MYIIRATVPLRPDERERGLKAAKALARDCRTHEDRTIDYRVSVDVDDDTVLRFFELYEDKAAVAAHEEADHYIEFMDRMDAFVRVEAIEATRYEVADAVELR